MRISTLFFSTVSASLALLIPISSANAGISVWNHNGSQMLMQANGSQRIISYLHPRRGISTRPGRVVFRGRRVGNFYKGTAYTFRRGCQPAPYAVSGRLGSETLIVLRGAAPVRRGCQITGYSRNSGNATLVFEYLRKTGEEGYSQDNQPQQEGPVEGPVIRTVKQIHGGKIIFRVQDEDAPAQTPIRVDVTAICHSGHKVTVIRNFRTCQWNGVRTLRDGSGFDMSYSNFGGGTCSRPDNKRIQTYGLCQ